MWQGATTVMVDDVRKVLMCACRQLKAPWPEVFLPIEQSTEFIDGVAGHSGMELLVAMARTVPQADEDMHRTLVKGCI